MAADDPFKVFRASPFTEEKPTVIEGEVWLDCQDCNVPCRRSDIGSRQWVHRGEVISLKSFDANFDHPARPNIIEVEVIDEITR